ncbi:MAG TPA: fused MFS/spermidine synthase, partial [Rubrobacteraceae bacterium]|nr:fused MFS/spermidine synthase [Rubrobacteraceae bacterium]
VAMVLHGELARDRPPARNLTEFYLWVAVGGVLGGIFNALIAPVAFRTVVEYPLVIVLAALFLPGAVLAQLTQRQREEDSVPQRRALHWALDLALPLALGVVVWALFWTTDYIIDPEFLELRTNFVVGLAVGVCMWFAYASNRPIRFGLGIAALIIATALATGQQSIYQDRSFFGAYAVRGDDAYHSLTHGSTNHGAQFLEATPPVPITYYHRTGPIGQLFDTLPEETVDSPAAMIGLGTGSMACYNKPGQQFTFYEIDPLIESIARDPDFFTYLRDCPGESEVVLGDARLSLRDAPDESYGVIVADAFSSDAIPVHLMTRESMELYFQKLLNDGALAFHISNRHLELEPVLGNLAQDMKLACYAQYDSETEDIPGKFGSHWVALAREEVDLGGVSEDPRWQPCETDPDLGVWTDDFSNLLATFDWN